MKLFRLYIFGWLFFTCLLLQAQDPDSILKTLPLIKSDTNKLKALQYLSENLPEGDWQQYNKQMGDLAKKLLSAKNETLAKKGKYFYAAYLGNVGYDEESHGRSDSAIVYYFKSLAIRKELHDKIGISNSYNNIGLAMHHKGDLAKALEYYLQGLAIQEEIKDTLGMGYSLSNIGYLLYNQGEHDKAIGYFKKSLVLRRKINDPGGLAYSLLNLGFTYEKKGLLDSALMYFEESLRTREKIGDKTGVGYSLNNIASIYQARGDYKAALACYQKSLVALQEAGDAAGTAATLNSIGLLFLEQKQYAKAIDYGKKTLAIGRQTGYPLDINNGAFLLYRAYKHRGQWREALQMFDLYIRMRDSLASADARKANLKKEMEYEYGKKEAEMTARSEAEKERILAVANEKKRRQNTILLGVTAVLLLVLLLAAIIFRSLQQNKKKNRIISEQKDLVEQKQKEILDSIYYARRIQRSLLPNEKMVHKLLNALKK